MNSHWPQLVMLFNVFVVGLVGLNAVRAFQTIYYTADVRNHLSSHSISKWPHLLH